MKISTSSKPIPVPPQEVFKSSSPSSLPSHTKQDPLPNAYSPHRDTPCLGNLFSIMSKPLCFLAKASFLFLDTGRSLLWNTPVKTTIFSAGIGAGLLYLGFSCGLISNPISLGITAGLTSLGIASGIGFLGFIGVATVWNALMANLR